MRCINSVKGKVEHFDEIISLEGIATSLKKLDALNNYALKKTSNALYDKQTISIFSYFWNSKSKFQILEQIFSIKPKIDLYIFLKIKASSQFIIF